MRKMSNTSPLWVVIACILILTACIIPSASQEDRIALGIAQTQLVQTQASLIDGDDVVVPAVETGAPPPEPSPTETQTVVPSLTPLPTITLTPTLDIPMVSVNRNTNCRTGPGEPYDIIGDLLVSEEAEVIGISSDGGTWIIKNPDGAGECWLWGYYASVNGPIEGLPVYTPPPTPTPQFDWAGNWTALYGDPAFWFEIELMTVTVNKKTFTSGINYFGEMVSLNGTISDDYLSVSGNWSGPTNNGTFTFFALGANQFQGNYKENGNINLLAWCGSRSGAVPNPCLKE